MFYKLIFGFMVFLSGNIWANELENIKTFEADFEQSIINSSNKEIKYNGKVFIKDSSKVLWKYETPIVKNVYIIRDFAIVDEPELEQAIFTSLNKEINILKLVRTAKEIKTDVYTTTMYDVQYTINIKQKKIDSIQYQDELENKVTISFTNVAQNQNIDDAIFKFKAPKGYDIIRK